MRLFVFNMYINIFQLLKFSRNHANVFEFIFYHNDFILSFIGRWRFSGIISGRPASVGPRTDEDICRRTIRNNCGTTSRGRRGDIWPQQDQSPGPRQAVRPEFHGRQWYINGHRNCHTGTYSFTLLLRIQVEKILYFK